LTEFITPNSEYFVRGHYLVPNVDIEEYEFNISIGKKEIKDLVLEDLKKYKEYD
jgi:hypothetical protein